MTVKRSSVAAVTPVFTKDAMVSGELTIVRCVRIEGQVFVINGRLVRTIGLEDEWFEDLRDPTIIIESLRNSGCPRFDLLTFWQRIPETEPRFPYPFEWEDVAVLPVNTYDYWWNHQIKSRVRNQIRKARKDGIDVREAVYDDDFVRGMTAIFNESPIRQGRRFWHYGKSFATVKSQFARHLDRERLIGAYVGDQMIGFMMLGVSQKFALTGQIISSLAHRDKSPNNALIAKAVEICEREGLEYLVYYFWTDDSLGEFKRRCGFERIQFPRYYVPLTARGALALRLSAHRGIAGMLPKHLKAGLKRARALWYESRGA
jgi:hypothetical protein